MWQSWKMRYGPSCMWRICVLPTDINLAHKHPWWALSLTSCRILCIRTWFMLSRAVWCKSLVWRNAFLSFTRLNGWKTLQYGPPNLLTDSSLAHLQHLSQLDLKKNTWDWGPGPNTPLPASRNPSTPPVISRCRWTHPPTLLVRKRMRASPLSLRSPLSSSLSLETEEEAVGSLSEAPVPKST